MTSPSPPTVSELQSRLQQGLTLHRQGNLAGAQQVYRGILGAEPRQIDALTLLGTLYLQISNFEAAVEYLSQAIAINPNAAATFINRGLALQALGRLDEALNDYDRALTRDPKQAAAQFNRGNVLRSLNRPNEALASYDQAVAINPGYAEAWNNRGNTLMELRRAEEALRSYDQALAIKVNYVEAHDNRGNALRELRRPEEALASHDRALTLDPVSPAALNNRGTTLLALGRAEEALASYDAALALSPAQAEFHYNRGNALRELMRTDEALASCDQAIALNGKYAPAFNNRGNALLDLRRTDEALASYEKAIALDPRNAEAHNNRGNALHTLERFEEALIEFDRSLALNPDFTDAHNNRGNVLVDLRRLDQAVISYDKALALDPGHPYLLGTALHTRMKLCDWASFGPQIERLKADIRAGKKVGLPFSLLALFDEPELQRQAAEIYVQAKFPRTSGLGAIAKRPARRRLRIGYFSADFRNHVVANYAAPLFEAHDTERVEVYGFSIGPDTQDEMRRRISGACTRFIDVCRRSDRDIAALSRELEIDIAVDLNGHTQHGRPGIFAERCAPIQIAYLGYAGTTGASFMDYLVADETTIPRDHYKHFTEKIISLPSTFLVNGMGMPISERRFARADFGLPEKGFVFCCFNNSYKILPDTFDIWMRLLKAVDGSVLWLRQEDEIAAVNLRREAAARGVDDRRLVFAGAIPVEEHLARHRLADLFLDTFPYNAHSTASDSLWAGLPLISCLGNSFAARVAGSLLAATDLPELITTTAEAYETQALALAKDPARFAAIKSKLVENRVGSPIFDAKLIASHIEAAYTAIHERHQSGLPPKSIRIEG